MEVRIDLNADLGESFGAYQMGADAEVLSFVTSANVACGFHAGDPTVIDQTVGEAVRAGVAVGAHPGHWDLRGFGRRAIAVDPEEVVADIVYQVGAVAGFARSHGTHIAHVKPHGALYNQAVGDEPLARAVARGVARSGPDLILVGLATSEIMRRAAEREGLRFAAEGFADRVYERDGTLRSRRLPGSVMTDPRRVAAQAVGIAREGVVLAADGTPVHLQADTICLHGDTENAVALARAVREALEGAGVLVRALAR